MLWATREFDDGWPQVQDLVQSQFETLGSPRDMMLVFVDDGPRMRLYLGLPETAMLSLHEGFLPVRSGDLPREATLLVGRQDEFERRFRFPRRSMGG